jgi:exonuclease VII large subunit
MSESSAPTVSSLNERLKQKQQQDREAIEAASQDALHQHEQTLSKLSSDALSTTKRAIQKRQRAIERELQQQQSRISEQTGELMQTHEREVRRLKWALRLPLATIALIFLIACGGIWGWWKVQTPWTVETMSTPNGPADYRVLKGTGWTQCPTRSRGKVPCRPVQSND